MLITYPLTLASAHSQSLASKSSPYLANSQGLDSRIVDWLRVSEFVHDNYCEYIYVNISLHCLILSCHAVTQIAGSIDLILILLVVSCFDCLAVGASRCLPKFRSNHSTVPG